MLMVYEASLFTSEAVSLICIVVSEGAVALHSTSEAVLEGAFALFALCRAILAAREAMPLGIRDGLAAGEKLFPAGIGLQ